MIELIDSGIDGCYEILIKKFEDQRGSFVKTFHEDIFKKFGLASNFAEEYYSISQKNVLRGLHFQIPPKQHTKLVYCVNGEVLDAVVDLRKNSKTYGKFKLFNLSAQKANMIYIPEGMAHGFLVKSESAIMMYKVTSIYAQKCDLGICWNSVGIPWEIENPIMSKRDKNFVTFKDFNTPFI